MISVETKASTFSVNVMTSDKGGLETDQIVELAMDKMVSVSDTAPQPIRDQAQAFKESLRHVLTHYINLARKEERATITHALRDAGHDDLADIVRRL